MAVATLGVSLGVAVSGCEATSSSTPQAPTVDAELSAQTRLAGTLRGSEGQSMAVAEIHVAIDGQAQVVEVGAEGRFELSAPTGTWVELRLTGVDHAEHTVGFLADGGDHRELDFVLGTYPRPAADEVGPVVAVGRFDSAGRISIPLSRRDDGTWATTLDPSKHGLEAAHSFYYQLSNITSVGRTINGTQADRYAYDGGGDYISIVDLPGGQPLELVWDPRAMPKPGSASRIVFASPGSRAARSAEIREAVEREREEAAAEVRARLAKGGDRDELRRRAGLTLREELARASEQVDDPWLQALWWVAWAAELPDEPSAAEREAAREQVAALLDRLDPQDPAWSLDPWALPTALRYVDRPQYFTLAASEHPNPEVGAALWVSALVEADHAGDFDRARAAKQALDQPRFASSEVQRLAAHFDPDRRTAPGKPVPEFRLQAIDGAELTPESLRGRVYVLDFWATWCGPCLAEMPNLHAAHEALGEVELISISLDHDPALVAEFRRERWPMPWTHAVPDTQAHARLTADFALAGIPTMVLVGRDGTILASSPSLDASSLAAIAGDRLGADG